MGFNPTLQYDETLKTSGLTNMIPTASSISPLAYGSKKKSMAQRAKQAALSYAQPLSLDSLVKRQKTGKIGENSTSSNRQSGTEIAIGNMKSNKQKEISLDNDKNTSTQTKKPHKETYMPTPQAVLTISSQEVPVHNEGKVQNPKA
ncbi:uncharacterized protein LOC133784195 [Humulus lupulus]|uniref:uncharacterized protein LOC133784195 n=1 Tax=Humulus lupulus TaxID=3486 RepID=UPI002B40642A|nr:uncharacterized protein LOC133784195 [Humulus lupulus]